MGAIATGVEDQSGDSLAQHLTPINAKAGKDCEANSSLRALRSRQPAQESVDRVSELRDVLFDYAPNDLEIDAEVVVAAMS